MKAQGAAPFESWAELEAIAEAIGPRYGPMILFAAATGLRPAEWIALEKRDIDRKRRHRMKLHGNAVGIST
jgi:integrase